uniref:NADH-ubiquinone oxidoreductase chain 4 n=1 Tax=Trichuris sp. LO613 TaxID=2856030 RepID=A0A8F5HSJ1_9BILA|nr:NADH dehydrogenase subunit 4 [Trichuris sp. LO613]
MKLYESNLTMKLAMTTLIWMFLGYAGSISITYSIDHSLPFMMMFLTLLLFSTYFTFMYKENKNYQNIVLGYFPLLMLFFSTNNILLFYILFEMSILPIFLMILGWGNQPERLTASNYLLFYTLIMSFPLLSLLLYLVSYFNNYWFSYVYMNNMMWLLLITPFLVKIPIYLLHLWLPKAHVEAPILGSMILASILLKTGGYGLLKMSCMCHIQFTKSLMSFMLMLILSASILCMLQTDLKKYIAYSSVTHMTIILALLLSEFTNSQSGSIFLMISHGSISNSLFFMVGLYSYCTMTRLLYSQLNIMISSTILWYSSMTILFLNTGMPPSLNMVNEMMMYINSSTIWCWNIIILFFSFVFMMYFPLWMMNNLNSMKTNTINNFRLEIIDLMILLLMPISILSTWLNSSMMM